MADVFLLTQRPVSVRAAVSISPELITASLAAGGGALWSRGGGATSGGVWELPKEQVKLLLGGGGGTHPPLMARHIFQLCTGGKGIRGLIQD